ncbi:MAG: rane protein [Firmicutes bacterium]|nr:rane protein [Bacillota bacterium]
MLGTIVNVAAIIIGSLLGFLIKGGIPKKVGDTVIQGLALSTMLIGILNAVEVNNLMLLIISMVIGSAIGEAIDIDRFLNNIGDMIEIKLKGRGGKVSQGFVTASLLFCVGAMAIVGSLNSGLKGDHSTLFSKSVLDFVFSLISASSLGIGVLLSSVSVFLYQGTITLLAESMKGFLIESVITDMSAIGGLLIMGISFNMLGMSKVKVANFLPAMFIPPVYQVILTLLGK